MDKEDRLFEDLTLSSFKFLITKYDFKLTDKEEKTFGYYIIYKNDSTAIEIGYVPRETGVSVLMYRLKDGELPEYPIFINDDTEVNSYYLDDLIALRVRNFKEEFGNIHKSEDYFDLNCISELAVALEKYGNDILNGDFEVFAELEKIVKNRAKELNTD